MTNLTKLTPHVGGRHGGVAMTHPHWPWLFVVLAALQLALPLAVA